MTPNPPFTTSSSARGHSPDAQYRIVRKRNRVPLSCGPCRHRKLKCNRSHPCENCIRRGDASSCSYAVPGTLKRSQTQGAATPNDMQNRIDRLEGLVLSLMTNGSQSAGPTAATAAISRSLSDSAASFTFPTEPERYDDNMIKEEDADNDSEVDGVTNSFGMIKVDQDKGKLMYFGDSHWNMVLRDIAEVKSYFSSHKKEMETNLERIKNSKSSTARDGPAFLFSAHPEASDSDLRAELPSKSAVDKLVTRYFSSYDPAVYILHSPTFHTQLQSHWQDPSKTSIVWLGLLYSILCLAMQSYHKFGDEPLEWKGRTLELAAEYRLRTVQCLVNSDYTVSSMYTIETMILYVHGEYNSSGLDAEVGIWVIVGIIVRLSMRMGYHRDPSKYPDLTPFEGEMRRRCWSFVRQIDTMFSFQLSLPSMIRSTDCDAQLPRNIFEDEISPESKILPPPRPMREPTPISYLISKANIAYEFGEIIEEINSVNGTHIGYEDVLKRDYRLRELKEEIAPHLRLRPLEECTDDPATLLMQRFNLDTFWQKTICVLHRKYFGRALQNPRYSHSRRACVDASMEILRHQSELHRESQPGGRMRTMKWFISSLTKHDYLLGAMIVSLDLHYDSSSRSLHLPPPNFDPYFWSSSQRAEMLQALKNSQAIWKESAETSIEAYKANKVLDIILEKLRLTTEGNGGPTTSEVFAHMDEASLAPEQSAAMTLGMLSGGLTPNPASIFNAMAQSPGGTRYANMDANMGDSLSSAGLMPNYGMDASNPLSSMNDVGSSFSIFGNIGPGIEMDMPGNLDWNAWDSYIQNGNPVDPNFQFYPTNLDQSLNADALQTPNDPYSFSDSVLMGSDAPGR